MNPGHVAWLQLADRNALRAVTDETEREDAQVAAVLAEVLG